MESGKREGSAVGRKKKNKKITQSKMIMKMKMHKQQSLTRGVAQCLDVGLLRGKLIKTFSQPI